MTDLYQEFKRFGMGNAYILLAEAVRVLRANAPIFETEGNTEQAASNIRQAEECEAAVKFISDRIGATP